MKSFISKIINIILKLYTKEHKIKNISKLSSVPKNILVISNTALGDTLLSIPALKSLKKSFPKSKITFLLNKKLYPLFENFEFVDEIIKSNNGYKNFISTILKIRKSKPEIVLIFHGNGPQDIQISVLSGANFILKHPTKSDLKKYLSFDFPQLTRHTIDDRLDMVRKIGGKEIESQMLLNEVAKKEPKLLQNFQKNQKIVIGFQLGAADVYKMWQIENFIKLAKKLLQNENVYILLTGIKKEEYLANEIAENINSNHLINTCGKLDLNELAFAISNLDILVSNDTGTMHLAIALQTPTICLFSTTNSILSGPHESQIGEHYLIQKDGLEVQKLPKKQRDNDLMNLISVEEVYEGIKTLLNKKGIVL